MADPGGWKNMSEVSDPEMICRDDRCKRLDIHPKHEMRDGPRVHHRPSKSATKLWERHDPKALTGAVARATSRGYPMYFAAIAANVRNDYGACCDRTIYRHLTALVQRGHLIKLDLGLALSAYVRPKSRLLKDLDSLRDYMIGVVDSYGAPCSKGSVGRRQPKLELRPELEPEPELEAAAL